MSEKKTKLTEEEISQRITDILIDGLSEKITVKSVALPVNDSDLGITVVILDLHGRVLALDDLRQIATSFGDPTASISSGDYKEELEIYLKINK